MSKTAGFYLLEQKLRNDYVWPTSHIFRRFRTLILIVVNLILMFHPFIMELRDYKMNIANLLFRCGFIVSFLAILFDNVELLRNQHGLFELISLLSDFNQFGIPKRMKFIEGNIKAVLKTIHYGGCFMGYLIAYYIMVKNDCAHVRNTNICFAIEYFIPYNLNQFETTLIMLFQIYTLAASLNIIFLAYLLYGYSFELLNIRIEHLKEMIDNAHLTKNKRRNFEILRSICLYHQDIFRIYKCVNGFFTNFLAPTKGCILVIITMSVTEFVLEKNFTSCWMIIMHISGLFFIHAVGQRFTTAAASVTDALYGLNWFDSDVFTRKNCVIFLCMSQHPLIIEVPLFGQMSYTSVAKEYKAVYAFYNWILTVIKQKIA